MRHSLQRRLVTAVGVALFAGICTSGFILQKFRGYEDAASRVMSGDQKFVLQGHLIEARLKAAVELAQASVNSEQANDAFREKIQRIADDVKGLYRERPDKALDSAKRVLENLTSSKAEAMEDLFVHYRNLKTSAFNIYRSAWANKWMTVAHNVGLIINDLDNLPYNAGEKAASSIYPKIGPLVALIQSSPISQESKLGLFSQLNALKAQIGQYTEAVGRSEKIRTQRVEDLTGLADVVKKYNDSQGKSLLQFGNEARTEVFKGIIAFMLLILFGMVWYTMTNARFSKHVQKTTSQLARQIAAWISAAGNSTASGFVKPEKPDAEFAETYDTLDQVIKRVNSLRKEDVLVKRLLNVPVLLVNRNKQAIFWNSALSILGKIRALEEMGPTAYSNLIRFTTAHGKVTDPVDKSFAENKEVSQLALLRVGDDALAVQAVCTPVLGSDHQAEYVMVHLRDLREENRRAESELDRQLEIVRQAMQALRENRVPADAPPGLRKPVVECVEGLKKHALELQERSSVLSGQVETMRDRMSREAGLKKSVHGRVEQVRDEIAGVRSQLVEIKEQSDGMSARVEQIETRSQVIKTEYGVVLSRGTDLAKDLKQSQDLIKKCLLRLEQTEEISSRVRANERMIRSLLEKSTVLNANNSILGSKRELTPADVVTITENITQLMGQFERGYRFIEQSVGEVERGLNDLARKLQENLGACTKLASDDQDLLNVIRQSERLLDASSEELGEFLIDLDSFKASTTNLSKQMQDVETKVQRLVQIGQASIELQTQLEIGFRGMLPEAEVAAVAAATADVHTGTLA